jgi:CHASE1-domain containing sensor protein
MTVLTVQDTKYPIEAVGIDNSVHSPPDSGRFGALARKPHWTGIVLAVMLSVTALVFFTTLGKDRDAARAQFEFRKAEVIDAIERRLAAYTQTLYGGLGLFNASDRVSRADWKAYVRTLRLESVFPGIQGLGFAEFVTPSRRKNYERSISAEGFPEFSIRPPGERPLYSSITFLEPFDLRNRQAFGYDMYSQETRRAAMDLARDTGAVAISGKVKLVQEITDDVQAGFLIYLPFYGRNKEPATIEERRRDIVGYVYSPFRMGDLMKGILGSGVPDISFRIYDGTDVSPDRLMYDASKLDTSRKPMFTDKIAFRFGQHAWTLVITSEPSFERQHNSTDATIILIAGVVTSLLIFSVL